MKDPLVSPAYADYLKGFPPCIITTGIRDLFLSDCVRLYWSLKQAHVPVELKVFEGMFHGFEIIPDIPEGEISRKEVAEFLKKYLE